MQRRDFIKVIAGSAAVWPLAAHAQQPAMPVIGYLSAVWPESSARLLAVFRESLAEAGYVEGRNVAIDYRFAEGLYDRLPAIAEELVRRRVAVVVAGSSPAALAAKGATDSIPIVFAANEDPVKADLVASLARPGGNATGVYFFNSELGAKQLGLLRELVPAAARIGLLINPNSEGAEDVVKKVETAASAIAVAIDVVQASDRNGIDAAFATLVRNKADALLSTPDPFFYGRRLQIATLATRHAIPAIYTVRDYAEVGGLMTYGASLTEAWRQLGVYTGRILNGVKPADLPVVQSIKFELIINAQTARALGLKISDNLLSLADEVIE
jgi:putative ABC transport system substrate-binding protein